MFFKKTQFEVIHSGRGGCISFIHKEQKEEFNIEMGSEGNFFIFTGKDIKFDSVKIELKSFLNSTGRSGWIICE